MTDDSQRFYMKVHPRFGHYLVAICDRELLGKTLIEDDIEFNVSEEFYGGSLVDIETCFKHLRQATMANMVGIETVTAAMKAGYRTMAKYRGCPNR